MTSPYETPPAGYPAEGYADDGTDDAADILSELLEASAATWSETQNTGITIAAVTQDDLAAITTTDDAANAETLMKLAMALINQAVQIDPDSARLIGAEAVLPQDTDQQQQ